MKQFSIIFITCLLATTAIAQDNFSLTLELVKNNDKQIYFQARLRNNNDSLSYFVDYQSNGQKLTSFKYALLKGIRLEKGKENIGDGQPFFEFGEKPYLLIKPNSEIIVRLTTFIFNYEIYTIGLLPPFEDQLRECQKIRIKLENFRFQPLLERASDPKPYYPPKTIDLYSNWVEINPDDFIPFLL